MFAGGLSSAIKTPGPPSASFRAFVGELSAVSPLSAGVFHPFP